MISLQSTPTTFEAPPSAANIDKMPEKKVDIAPSEKIGVNEHNEVAEWFNDKIPLKTYTKIYLDKFIENGFDNMRSIKLLTDNDLKEIGINKLGHRKLIIKAVRDI